MRSYTILARLRLGLKAILRSITGRGISSGRSSKTRHPLLWEALPAHLMSNIIYQLNYTLRGHGGVLWKAIMDALRGLSRAMRKRQEILKTSKACSLELLRTMEHGPLQPYLLGYQIRKIRQTMSSSQ